MARLEKIDNIKKWYDSIFEVIDRSIYAPLVHKIVDPIIEAIIGDIRCAKLSTRPGQGIFRPTQAVLEVRLDIKRA